MIVRITSRAEADLDHIFDESVRLWGIEQARSYVDAILTTFDRIAGRSVIWRSIPADLDVVGYRCRSGRHFIYWRATACDVTIVAVLHDRMDQVRHLGDDPG